MFLSVKRKDCASICKILFLIGNAFYTLQIQYNFAFHFVFYSRLTILSDFVFESKLSNDRSCEENKILVNMSVPVFQENCFDLFGSFDPGMRTCRFECQLRFSPRLFTILIQTLILSLIITQILTNPNLTHIVHDRYALANLVLHIYYL